MCTGRFRMLEQGIRGIARLPAATATSQGTENHTLSSMRADSPVPDVAGGGRKRGSTTRISRNVPHSASNMPAARLACRRTRETPAAQVGSLPYTHAGSNGSHRQRLFCKIGVEPHDSVGFVRLGCASVVSLPIISE